MAENWFVLHVKPNKERTVQRMLCARGWHIYYPRLTVKPVNPRSRRERPLFPGYLLVLLDLAAAGRDALRWTENTYGLVAFGGEPVAIAAEQVRAIRRRIEAINASGGLVFERLKQGDRVTITHGVLAGLEAVFERRIGDRERVQIFLHYLQNKAVRVQLDANHIEKSSPRRRALPRAARR